jgi:hypothetical protein
MTIHWKALEECFLMVHVLFDSAILGREKIKFSEFFSKTCPSYGRIAE